MLKERRKFISCIDIVGMDSLCKIHAESALWTQILVEYLLHSEHLTQSEPFSETQNMDIGYSDRYELSEHLYCHGGLDLI